MNTPPPLNVSRSGISNFPEIRKWAERNSNEWVLVERWRKIHGWTDKEFLEVLSCQLLIALVTAQQAAIDTAMQHGSTIVPMPPVSPPDPEVPPLYQIEEEPPSRMGAAVLIGIAMFLALAAGSLWLFGHGLPAGICVTATIACCIRASRYPA